MNYRRTCCERSTFLVPEMLMFLVFVAFFNVLSFTLYYFYFCTEGAYAMSSRNHSISASVSSVTIVVYYLNEPSVLCSC